MLKGVLKRVRRKYVKAHINNNKRAKEFYKDLYEVLAWKE